MSLPCGASWNNYDQEAIERTRKYANLYRYILKPWDEATLIEVLESGLEGMDE